MSDPKDVLNALVTIARAGVMSPPVGEMSAAGSAWAESQLQMIQAAEEILAGLEEKLHISLSMLADWCVAVDCNGSGWDDWDEHYKQAMYRACPLREDLDKAIAEARDRWAAGNRP